MNDSSELSRLPDWEVQYQIGSQVKKPVTKAPNAAKAEEYIRFEVRQTSNQPIKILKVTRVKRP